MTAGSSSPPRGMARQSHVRPALTPRASMSITMCCWGEGQTEQHIWAHDHAHPLTIILYYAMCSRTPRASMSISMCCWEEAREQATVLRALCSMHVASEP